MKIVVEIIYATVSVFRLLNEGIMLYEFDYVVCIIKFI